MDQKLKRITDEVKPIINDYRYRKRGNSFWKIENGFYKLIHFQGGAYGDYFFINAALHPVGLPMLCQSQLKIIDKPKEYNCALHERLEQISSKAILFPHRVGFIEDVENAQALLEAVMPDIERWLNQWGSYERIITSDLDEMSKLFSVVPILFKKEFWLLKSYCALTMGNQAGAEEYFLAYRQENPDMDFRLVDDYMSNLINSSLSDKPSINRHRPHHGFDEGL